jgi:protein MpaA
MSADRGTARVLALGACLATLGLVVLAGHARARSPDASAHVPIRIVIVGYSVDDRPIRAFVVGEPTAARRILVVGCVHGTEPAGEAITRRLRSLAPPAGAVWWLVDQFNPDGCLAGTRQNAHGVDLNRNAPWRWQHLEQPGGTFYSGPYPLSEPESRAINRLVKRLRPAVSIWYHQHASMVDSSSGGDPAIESRYARTVGLPFRAYPFVPGSITSWQDATFPQDTAFVVELPPGALPPSSVARHVAAIIALSKPPAKPAARSGALARPQRALALNVRNGVLVRAQST